jgi:hypothetical protein
MKGGKLKIIVGKFIHENIIKEEKVQNLYGNNHQFVFFISSSFIKE